MFWLTASSRASSRTEGSRSPGRTLPEAQCDAIWSAICREMGTAEPFSMRRNMAKTAGNASDYRSVTVVRWRRQEICDFRN